MAIVAEPAQMNPRLTVFALDVMARVQHPARVVWTVPAIRNAMTAKVQEDLVDFRALVVVATCGPYVIVATEQV